MSLYIKRRKTFYRQNRFIRIGMYPFTTILCIVNQINFHTFNSETFIFIRDWYSSAPTRNFNIIYYILIVRNPSDRNHECRWPLVERCFPAFFFFPCLCVYFKRYKPFSETNDKSQQYIL